MKSMKKLIAIVAAVGVLGTAGAVFAAAAKSPAEIVSGLTGKSVEELQKERLAGKTYGTIAEENGKLDEFKSQMLEQKKVILDQRVEEGRLTQEQADEIYNAIKENQASCDGTGSASIGRKYGAGFGQGMGNCQGRGFGAGMGRGQGKGFGAGMGRGCGMGAGFSK